MVDAIQLPPPNNSRVARGAGQSGGRAVPEWRLAARLRPLRKFRIGAVFERQVRCRGCGSKPDRDWSRTRPSAVVGSGGGGKESVRCRAVHSHGPSHRQRLVLGIGGGRWALFGDKEWRCGTASTTSMERAAGDGAWIPSGRLVRVTPGGRIASRAPACSLWSAIAEIHSKLARPERGTEMPISYIAHFEKAQGARVYRKRRLQQFDLSPSARTCTRDINGVGPLKRPRIWDNGV